MAVNDAGFWSPDDTEIFAPPTTGLHSWMKRQADSVARPEGTVTQPWRVHYKDFNNLIAHDTFTDISTNNWGASANDPGDTASGITHSSAGYTVSQNGWYRIELDCAYQPNATGFRMAQLRINGSTHRTIASVPSSTTDSFTQCAVEVSLVAGDVVSFWTRQTSGGNLNLIGGSGTNRSRKFIRRVALL